MFRILSKFAAVPVLSATLVAAGCQSTATSPPASSDMAAIACDQCKTTYTRVPVSSGNPRSAGIVGYRTVATHECPDCTNVATKQLQQGKSLVPGEVVHKCTKCGGEMKVCHRAA